MRRTLLTLFIFLGLGTIYCNAQWEPRIPLPDNYIEAQDTVSLTIIGDVMMHSKQLEYDHSTFLENLFTLLQGSDFCAANMEFALGGMPYSGYPAFSAPDSYAYSVAQAGVNVFLTANNHILDKGSKGLVRTHEIYRSMTDSVAWTGSGGSKEEFEQQNPIFLFKKGIKLALINFTYGTNVGKPMTFPRPMYMEKTEIAAAIDRAKQAKADFIIALPHWGQEYQLKHSPEQESWAKWLIDSGVDAIVGSHPHVVQDSTHIDGKCVIYSVGNAVSNMSAINTRIELAVKLKFVITRWTREMKMLEPELIPLWCTLPGTLRNNYSTIIIKEWATRRSEWLNPSDYDNMISSLKRVSTQTGTEIYSLLTEAACE